MTLALAVLAGLAIGISLGALGGGGSILAVPVLVYLLDQSALQATTGSLVVVGVTALIGAVTAHRAGNVRLGQGAVFGLLAVGGAVLGARLSTNVDDDVLLAAFAGLMLLVGALMVTRQLRHRDREPRTASTDPILSVTPTLSCDCPRAVKLLVAATVVGLLTGFFGVGGGFVVVPAMVLVLELPMAYAAGTSLVVITVTSAAALGARVGSGAQPDWLLVGALTVASALGSFVGARVAARTDQRRLSAAFTTLVLLVAVYTAARSVPALV